MAPFVRPYNDVTPTAQWIGRLTTWIRWCGMRGSAKAPVLTSKSPTPPHLCTRQQLGPGRAIWSPQLGRSWGGGGGGMCAMVAELGRLCVTVLRADVQLRCTRQESSWCPNGQHFSTGRFHHSQWVHPSAACVTIVGSEGRGGGGRITHTRHLVRAHGACGTHPSPITG